MIISENQIMQHIREVTGVLHVGAHEAQELPFYRKWFGKSVPILWVEADPETAERLFEETALDDFSFQAILALGDIEGYRQFHRMNMDQSSSLLELGTHKTAHPEVKEVDVFEVWVETLDRLAFDWELEQHNFLNMDVQGAEGMVIKGGMHHIRNYVDYIYTEVNVEELYEGCMLLPQMDEVLDDLGFDRVETEIYDQFGWGDALYIAR